MSHTTALSDDYVSLAEAAEYFGKSVQTVDRWVKDGILPAVRVGPRAIRIRRADLDSIIRPVVPGDES